MKKTVALLLSILLVASLVPADNYALAAGTTSEAAVDSVSITKDDSKGSTTEPTDVKLESVIIAVKDVISVPKEYSDFNYNFYNTNSYSDSYWSLTWRNPSDNSYIQVNCDMDNHITSYYKYQNRDNNEGIAKYLKSELKATADSFIKKIAPEVSASIEFTGADYQGTYNGNYIYNYQRKNNGVTFPDNMVSVNVSSITGEVTSASINWLYEVSVPSSEVKTSKEEAIALIKNNMKMKLIYRTNYYYYDRNGSNTAKKAYLVYEPTEDYISVDAKTGEIYKTRSEWISTNEGDFTGAKETMAKSDSADGSRNLTDEEIVKIEDLKKLISKSDAIKSITGNKYLYLDKNLSSYTATLEKREDGNTDSTYVWNINFNDPREINYETDKDTYRGYAYASVDAKTGKILSFRSSLKSNYDEVNKIWNSVKIAYDKEQGRTVLEKFIKTQMKDHFSNTILSEETDDYIAYYKDNDKTPVYGGYYYQYNRVNEGVEFPNNNISGAVDGVTGKVYSFGSYWDKNITFEATKGVISADEAMNYYLSKEGFGLKYEINTINKYNVGKKTSEELYENTDALKVEYEIRLVYRPDVTPGYISPFTGEQLNYNGEVYTETKPYAYKDIVNNEKNRNVLLLADMNIGFQGENFLPDQYITLGELQELLSGVGYYDSSIDTTQLKSTIEKEEIAQIFINKLGLQKMSELPGIYKTGYNDEYKINSKYLGAVALAKGLGIMTGDSNNDFNPKNNITRFEAVDLIMAFIAAQRSSIYY